MTKQLLTTNRQRYLELLQLADAEQRSICQLAKENENHLDPSLLYSARATLRR